MSLLSKSTSRSLLLRQHIEDEFCRINLDSAIMSDKIIRAEIPIPSINPLLWLAHQTAYDQIFWKSRDNRFSVAAVGCAHRITAKRGESKKDVVDRVLQGISGAKKDIRYYGGLAFSESKPVVSDYWKAMGQGYFLLPEFEIIEKDEKCYFVFNQYCDEGFTNKNIKEVLLSKIDNLSFDGYQNDFQEALSYDFERADLPSRKMWDEIFVKSHDILSSGLLNKIVLARETNIQLTQTINPCLLLLELMKQTPHCYYFLYSPDYRNAFIGTSPERLYCRNGREIKSEVLAGTRPRHLSSREDSRLAQDLMSSDKENREHAYVKQGIQERLQYLCTAFDFSQKSSLLKLKYQQHLYCEGSGRLLDHVYDGDVIQELHPTPAVGGYPVKDAISIIDEIEPFNRGWYAGPVGWLSQDEAEFSVAIRSALIHSKSVRLYAGAGIVDGSCVDSEWDEIEGKILNYLNFFSGNNECKK